MCSINFMSFLAVQSWRVWSIGGHDLLFLASPIAQSLLGLRISPSMTAVEALVGQAGKVSVQQSVLLLFCTRSSCRWYASCSNLLHLTTVKCLGDILIKQG